VTAPPDALEVMLRQLDAPPEAVPADRLGHAWTLDRHIIKRYPAQYLLQGAVEAALALHAQGVRAEQIEAVTVYGHAGLCGGVHGAPHAYAPASHEDADHSTTFVVALALFLVGGLVSIQRGVSGIVHPEELPDLWIGVGVLVAAAVFEGSALRIALRTFNRERGRRSFYSGIRRAKDPETLTVVFEDTAALTGIVVAIAGVVLAHVLDDSRFDAAGAVLIGLILCAVAVALAREVKDLLIGESANRETRETIQRAVDSIPEVEGVRELLTMQVGPDEILVNVDVCFRDGLDTDGVEEAIMRVEDAIRGCVPTAAKIFVEPASPSGPR
jgi:divalent metal cation (Fe/Co/Zn/Cd) transporter